VVRRDAEGVSKLVSRPEGPTINSPGRQAGVWMRKNNERRRRDTLNALSKGFIRAKSRAFGAHYCFLPNPGLTAGAIQSRPFGPRFSSLQSFETPSLALPGTFAGRHASYV
jgi:hypothetical protein